MLEWYVWNKQLITIPVEKIDFFELTNKDIYIKAKKTTPNNVLGEKLQDKENKKCKQNETDYKL